MKRKRTVETGDMVYPVFKGKHPYLTSKKVYRVIKVYFKGVSFNIKNNRGNTSYCRIENCAHLKNNKFSGH